MFPPQHIFVNFDICSYMHLSAPPYSKKYLLYVDPAHMMKLVRNSFEFYGRIKCNNGIIDWSFVTKLHKIQITKGLCLASKLTDQHINFKNHKMSVKELC